MSKDHLLIAQIGKTVGLHGDLKLHLYTDFPEQFKKDSTVITTLGKLTISRYDNKRSLVRFTGYDTKESAGKLVNVKIYSSKEQSRSECALKDGEFFWFDIIGLVVEDRGIATGKVMEIQRLQGVDYLFIKTSKELILDGYPSNYLLPFIGRYIMSVDLKKGIIISNGAFDILEAS